MSVPNEMQKRAEEIYLESITPESDYKPISLSKLCDILREEGYTTSTSALGRWKQKFDWGKKAEAIVTSALADGEAKAIVERSSIDANVQKIVDDFEANESLKNDAYALLQDQMRYYRTLMERNGKLSLDNAKMVLKILEVTSNREDKLLDRQAMLAAAKMADPDDVMRRLEAIDIDIDEESAQGEFDA